MAGFQLAVLALLTSVLPAVAAKPDTWGPEVEGLSISVSLAGTGGNRDLQVNFRYLGQNDTLVPFGVTYGKPHPVFLKMVVRRPGSAPLKVIYTGLGALTGAVQPLRMALRTGETSKVMIPIERYYVPDASETLAAFIKRECDLWIRLEVSESECPRGSEVENPRPIPLRPPVIPCWHGTVRSNVLHLPK